MIIDKLIPWHFSRTHSNQVPFVKAMTSLCMQYFIIRLTLSCHLHCIYFFYLILFFIFARLHVILSSSASMNCFHSPPVFRAHWEQISQTRLIKTKEWRPQKNTVTEQLSLSSIMERADSQFFFCFCFCIWLF